MISIRDVRPGDAEEILEIYRPFVTDTAVSFEYEPPDVEEMRRRIIDTTETYPWLVALTTTPLPQAGQGLLGYAYASSHRSRAAYQWSVEVSVYVHPDARRGGIARALYSGLFERLRERGVFNAFAGITLPNDASVGFHESMGFQPIGVYPRIGYKFGQWHDVGWWGLRLRDDDEPLPPRTSLT